MLDTLPRLITVLSFFFDCLSPLVSSLSHHVLAILLAAAYFSHRGSSLYTGSS